MPARKYFKEDFDRILNDEFNGDVKELCSSSSSNMDMYQEAVRCGWCAKHYMGTYPRKYYKEDFHRILNDEFNGDKIAMYRSSDFNRKLYFAAVKNRWTTSAFPGRNANRYSVDDFRRILETFNGDPMRMRKSSEANMKMVDAARSHGWIPKRKVPCGMFHRLYIFAFPPIPSAGLGISVYVGITSRHPEDRRNGHIIDPNSAVYAFAKEHGVDVPPIQVVESHISASDVATREQLWIDRFSDMGWNVLNRQKGGNLGGYFMLSMSPEEAKAVIDRYSTMNEFRKKDQATYQRINKFANLGHAEWIDVHKYMHSKLILGRRKYTYEECVDLARKCSSSSDMFKRHANAFRYMTHRGLVGKMCEEAGIPYQRIFPISVVGTPVSGHGRTVKFRTIADAAAFANTNPPTIALYVHGKNKKNASFAGYYWKIDDSKQNCHTETRIKKGNQT